MAMLYAPNSQQPAAPWPGAGSSDPNADPNALAAAYQMYQNQMAGVQAGVHPGAANPFSQQQQMQPQVPQGMLPPQQPQQQQQGTQPPFPGYPGAVGITGNSPAGGAYGGGNGNGAFGGSFGAGGGYSDRGAQNAFGNGGYGGNFAGGYDAYAGAGMYFDDDGYFYPRYNQGTGPEYAQNELAAEDCGDPEEGLQVTHYGEAGEIIPKALSTWDEAQMVFPPALIQECRNAGFAAPMPIQAHSWGIGAAGRDLIGVAKTGSGKTIAYLFVGFAKMMSQQQRTAPPGMLVLAPTRELAQQIESESVKFGRPLRITTACCYGGASRGPQLGQIRRGAQVIVATPGRLNDFLQAGQLRLGTCGFLVLDEADRMLDLGFEPQIRSIIEKFPPVRQTLLYTATWPKELRSLASDFLTKPIHVHVGSGDKLAANKDIEQVAILVQNEQAKMDELRNILQGCQQGDRVLIFCETKMSTANLATQLSQVERIYSVAIHGDLAQRDRDWALKAFRSGKAPIMVATDVAGRGLDIKGITYVVNWDAAHSAEDYVHRIGRCGRAGEKGRAYTFLSPSENRKARDIVLVMENTGIQPPPELLQLSGRGQKHGKGKKGKGKGKGRSFGGGGGKGKGFGKGKGGGFGGGGGFRSGGAPGAVPQSQDAPHSGGFTGAGLRVP